MENKKEDALFNFKKMIRQSWTYQKLTKEEQDQLEKTFEDTAVKKAIKGTYNQRWETLQAIYHAFLLGVGYNSFNWREKEGL